MKNQDVNPCAGCPVNCCCDLRKLKLSPAEYRRVYEPFLGQFETERKSALYELSMHADKNCPHWGEQTQCTIYETRPVECRLVPYTVNQTYKAGRLVLFTYHGKTPCPRKQNGLFPPHKEARRLVRALARDTYGSGNLILACYESLAYRGISKLTRVLCFKKIAGLFRR